MKDNTPSATAIVVAKNVALIAATPSLAHLVPPAASELTGLLINAYRRRGGAFLRMAQHRWFQFLFQCYERCTIPGLALHQALRKLHIERIVRESLAEGFKQVVILGGGLDTLALRLHKEFPLVNFFELDHPDTQRVKGEVTERRQLAGSNLRLIPVDLAVQPLEGFLAANSDYEPRRDHLPERRRADVPGSCASRGLIRRASAAEGSRSPLRLQLHGTGFASKTRFPELDLDRAGLAPAEE